MSRLLVLLLLVGCTPADDLTGDWHGPASCDSGIELDVSLWFEVQSGDRFRGEAFMVWEDLWEDDGWRFRLFMDVEARLAGTGDDRSLEASLSQCEASPFTDWPCPGEMSLDWHLDEPTVDGGFQFGVLTDGDPSWSECHVLLER